MTRSSAFPSTGSELLDWQEVWCFRCAHDHHMSHGPEFEDESGGCDIMLRATIDEATPEVVQSGYVVVFEDEDGDRHDHTIANQVREWCLANGDNPRLRIVLAGYTTEHDHLIPPTWRRVRWSSSAAYQTTAAAKRAADGHADGNLANRHGETLWLSPHCLDEGGQLDLFGGDAA